MPLPKRWKNYKPMGHQVSGTRFLPFKVPLEMDILKHHPESIWFTPAMLLQMNPNVRAIIDLTETRRYYNPVEFTSKGVIYKKFGIEGGGRLPKPNKCYEFFDIVDKLLKEFDEDADALIGVHCTHGLNRTGYFICKYMTVKMKIDPKAAISKFQEARGYSMERSTYINDIIQPIYKYKLNSRRHFGDGQNLRQK